jgi:predicted CXXCH cytochrome family protein
MLSFSEGKIIKARKITRSYILIGALIAVMLYLAYIFDVLTVTLAFLAICAGWALILFFSMGRFYQKKYKAPLKGFKILYPIIGLFILAMIVYVLVITYEYTESPEFCAKACHSMEPYTETYENPGNNTVLKVHRDNDVVCADCHNGPGFLGTAETRIEGLGMLFAEITGDFDPDKFKGHVPNEFCEKSGCHDDVDWKIQAVDGDIYHPFTNDGENSPVTGDLCVDCHNPRLGGTGLAKNSCNICHDVTDEELEAHEVRTCGQTTCHGEDVEGGHRPGQRPKEDACINCHNRLHPDDAKIPFSFVDNYVREGVDINLTVNDEFCSDCHRENYDLFTAVSTGSCQDCHVRHKEKESPHKEPTEEAFNCSECHVKIPTEHNPNVVSFKNIFFSLENDFCLDCHQPEYDAFLSHNTGKCIDCHSNHEIPEPPHVIPTMAYETCTKCHVEIPDKHNAKIVDYQNFPSAQIDNVFCASCHFTEYTFYTTNNTGRCTECHEKHESPKPAHIDSGLYQNCDSCHMNIVDQHDPRDVTYQNFPFSEVTNEFCSICHNDEYVAYTENVTPKIEEIYGGCTDCHNEHRQTTYPHRINDQYNDCFDCHTNYHRDTTIHDPTGIEYRNFTATLENEFCSDCHQNPFDSLTDKSDPDKKHTTRDCTNCHKEHREVQVQFSDVCSVCHDTNIPPDHDEDLKDCNDCHEVEKYIHDLNS